MWQSVDPILGQYIDGQPNGGIYIPITLGMYSYAVNNPVRYKDDDGEFINFIVGAIAGAGTDIAFQVAVQMATGQEISVDWGSVAGSAALGATGVGVANVVAKGANALKSVKAVRQAAQARGKVSEARVLKDLGLKSNKAKVSTKEGNSIPDALTKKLSLEVKDTKSVSLTKQLRIQIGAAKKNGQKSILVTGKNTNVSGPTLKAFDQIIRRKDLGPQSLLTKPQAAGAGVAADLSHKSLDD